MYFSSPSNSFATVIKSCVPVVLRPHSLPSSQSLRYLDVNNVGITYLLAMSLRSTRLTAHHVSTPSIGQMASWQRTVSAFARVSVCAKRRAAEPDVPCVRSYRAAYKNREVIVILSRGYRVQHPSIKVSEHARTSDLARNVRFDIPQVTPVSLSLTECYTLACTCRNLGSFSAKSTWCQRISAQIVHTTIFRQKPIWDGETD
jgi:hypothetical protein